MKKFLVFLTFGTIIAVSWLVSRDLHMQEQLKPVSECGIHKQITIWIPGTRGTAFLPVGISERTSTLEKQICSAPLGLHKVTEIDPQFHSHAIAQILSSVDPEQFSLKDFYSFGWSGKLDPQARKQAAQELHDYITQLVLNYIVQNATIPEVTLITHSHGGNVALNLAAIAPAQSPLIIDRLILLACPVQQETAAFADAPIFKQVYAFHSHNDQLQVLDPQKLHPIKDGIQKAVSTQSLAPLAQAAQESNQLPLFSERHFASARVKHVNCSWQIRAPWSEEDLKPFGSLSGIVKKWAALDTKPRGLLHIEFLLHSFVSRIPEIITFADNCQNAPEKNIDLEFNL